MKAEQKKYILENIDRKSVKEISNELGLKERKVRKLLEEYNIKERKAPRAEHPGREVSKIAPAEEAPFGIKLHPVFIIAIIAMVFIVYANALPNDFIWDDEFLVRDNTYIRSFSHIFNIFKSYLAVSSGNINNFYRPIQDLSYMVDYSIWQTNPFGYHLTNVILHAICAILVYALAFKILKNTAAAFVAGALFGVHPINTEAVAYVAGRADSLYLIFFLASFILFMKMAEALCRGQRSDVSIYAISLASYAVSALSKEIALILPVMLLLYVAVFYSGTGISNRLYRLIMPFGGVFLLYIILRKTVLDFSGLAPSFAMGKFNLYLRLLTTFKATCVYMGLLIAPFDLHMERRIPVARSLFEPHSMMAAAVIIALLALTVIAHSRSKKLFFALLWFFIGLIPVSNIVPINSFIAEHWVYMPAIGIYMIAGLGAGKIFAISKEKALSSLWKFLMIAALIAAFSFYGILTIARNKDWKDEISFFKNTLKYSPKNARLHLNFGNTYAEHGQRENAIEEYKKTIELDPNFAEAYSNIGAMYLGMNRITEARIFIERALSIKPDFPNALYMAGILYENENDYERAESCYLKALKIMPDFIDCHLSLGKVYYKTARRDNALYHWKEALRINPANDEAKRLIDKYFGEP